MEVPRREPEQAGEAARAVTSREVRPFAAQAASSPRPPAITPSDPAPGSSARAEPHARDELRTAGITVITPEDELATETQTHGPDVRGGERWDAGSRSDPSNLNSGAARLATSYRGEPNRDSRGGTAAGCTSHAHRYAEARTSETCRRLAQREREAKADPAPVREHVTRLREAGGTYQAIAAAAGLGVMTVHAVVNRDGRVTATTAAALLGVSSAGLPRARRDAGGTRLRLRALQVMGHGSARVARAIGVREQAIRAIVRGDACTVTPVLRDAVARTYDAWWDKRPPERTRDERTAATAARRRAIRGNWCAGACLDDDELDIPGYQPASGWRPACGTGVAGDITPPARTTRRSWAL
jgi:hypothetical protein